MHTATTTVRIDAKVKTQLQKIGAKIGMSDCQMMSRIGKLLTELPPSVQTAALDLFPEDYQVEIAELILQLRRDQGKARRGKSS